MECATSIDPRFHSRVLVASFLRSGRHVIDLDGMESWQHFVSGPGRFLDKEWHWWPVIGWMGNLAFGMRVLIQWHATEKRREVVVPLAFWWLSLAGSCCLLTYAVFWNHDIVIIVANAFNWIPALRNLMIHRAHVRVRLTCASCGSTHPRTARFCAACGNSLTPTPPTTQP